MKANVFEMIVVESKQTPKTLECHSHLCGFFYFVSLKEI